MDFDELIQTRYSVRSYLSDPIEENLVTRILDASRLAPTAANRQPFRLIVVKTAGKEEELRAVYNKEWFVQAPLVICACGVPSEAWVRSDGKIYLDVDIAIVVDHLILAASNEGLGTCWIAGFNKLEARKFFSLPDEIEPIILTPLGYAADIPQQKIRKSLDQLIYYEHWGGNNL